MDLIISQMVFERERERENERENEGARVRKRGERVVMFSISPHNALTVSFHMLIHYALD